MARLSDSLENFSFLKTPTPDPSSYVTGLKSRMQALRQPSSCESLSQLSILCFCPSQRCQKATPAFVRWSFSCVGQVWQVFHPGPERSCWYGVHRQAQTGDLATTTSTVDMPLSPTLTVDMPLSPISRLLLQVCLPNPQLLLMALRAWTLELPVLAAESIGQLILWISFTRSLGGELCGGHIC